MISLSINCFASKWFVILLWKKIHSCFTFTNGNRNTETWCSSFQLQRKSNQHSSQHRRHIFSPQVAPSLVRSKWLGTDSGSQAWWGVRCNDMIGWQVACQGTLFRVGVNREGWRDRAGVSRLTICIYCGVLRPATLAIAAPYQSW